MEISSGLTIAGFVAILSLSVTTLWWVFGVHRKAGDASDLAQESWEMINKHRDNAAIHFEEKTAKQVELRLTSEIDNLKKTVDKIDGKVDRLLERK